MMRMALLLVSMLCLSSCVSTSLQNRPENSIPLQASEVEQPAGWADDLALTIPQDINPDPNILEINLEARITEMEILPGKLTPVWTYGGALQAH